MSDRLPKPPVERPRNSVLEPWQVPSSPTYGDWVDVLRWALVVMDDGDERMVVLADHLARHLIEPTGKEERRRIMKILGEIWMEFASSELACQQVGLPRVDLVKVEGAA